MSTGESVDFTDYHRWRLERIIELTDRLSGFSKPTWAFSLAADKTLQLEPSTLKDIATESGDRNEVEQEGLGIFLESRKDRAYTQIMAAYALGLMNQAASLKEEEIPGTSTPDPRTTLLRCSDAGFLAHEFADKTTGEEYEVSRTWVSGVGLRDEPMKVETVSIEKKDDLLSEKLSIHRIKEKLGVFRQINPVEDELMQRLIRTARIGSENPDLELYNTGFAAMTGLPDAEQRIYTLVTTEGDDEFGRLAADLKERLRMVRTSRAMNFNQNLPTEEQLDQMIELLEEMAETD